MIQHTHTHKEIYKLFLICVSDLPDIFFCFSGSGVWIWAKKYLDMYYISLKDVLNKLLEIQIFALSLLKPNVNISWLYKHICKLSLSLNILISNCETKGWVTILKQNQSSTCWTPGPGCRMFGVRKGVHPRFKPFTPLAGLLAGLTHPWLAGLPNHWACWR